jgi:hypothetical protein
VAGAFLGLLSKSKGRHPEKSAPPNDAVEGSKYSKTTDVETSEGPESYDDDTNGTQDDEADHSAAFDAFAHHAGIPEEKRSGARAALKLYVKECMRKGDTDEDGK